MSKTLLLVERIRDAKGPWYFRAEFETDGLEAVIRIGWWREGSLDVDGKVLNVDAWGAGLLMRATETAYRERDAFVRMVIP